MQNRNLIADLVGKIQILETEVEILNTVKTNQEEQVIEGYKKMDTMIQEIERKRNDLQSQNDAIHKAAEFIERVIDTMDEALIVLSNDQSIIKVNKKFLLLTGYAESEVIHKFPDQFFAEESLLKIKGNYIENSDYKSIIYKAFSHKKNIEWMAEIVSISGKRIPHLFRGSPLRSAVGKNEGMVLVGADIRELTKIQKDLMDSINQVNEMLIKMNILTSKIQKYVPEQLVNVILTENESYDENTYAKKKLTIFFSDIVGFTEVSDQLDAVSLAEVLNFYLNEMVLIATKYGGTIDKFIGDAIVVFFGDPISRGEVEDATACVNMALEMKKRIKEMSGIWKEKGMNKHLQVRIGINTGYVTVGDFGSDKRKDYTIIGKDANVASRLQTAADPDSILISSSTNELINKRFNTKDKGYINAKGIAEPVRVYELMSQFDPI